ncbi:MAG: bifunctional folylpolyglutamate synthase/dihydrofolate synthase [Chloroflexota bacterium]|nr:bifunctional folylpolyglutamate synthase/dihydrofolate synthase [Chloroflexota bacterium]
MPEIEARLWSLAHASPVRERPDLGRMRRLLARLGDPQIGLPVLHVGGTAGKGSTATIAAALLTAAGYRTGLHTKPHLRCVNERIVVNGAPISDEDLLALIEEATPAARAVQPTWYEFTVALAFLHFRRIAVEIAVIEVGLGGTYDGTNVVQPLVAVLTNVGLDHTEILGDTVEEIARDKVAIIKPGCIAITGVTQPSVQEIVAERAAEVDAPLWRLGQEIQLTIHRDSVQSQESFAVTVQEDQPRWQDSTLRLNLLGEHQMTNAALAIAGVHALDRFGLAIHHDVVSRTLPTIRIPGRLEVVSTSPTVVLDGAHNPDKLDALLAALPAYFEYRRLVIVAAFTRRHDVAAMLARLAPVVDHIVLTSFAMYGDFGPGQAIPPDELAALFATFQPRGTSAAVPDPIAAVAAAREWATSDDCVCVTGSLYLVGAVRETLLRNDLGGGGL